ncbi:phospho-2-dehydro-3-deoxyheptonate aldolase [Roseiflexus castenholzii DSM 13941]|uniref:Phospho-2-dehydro-3-deoxyheptonate aldolase n=2 Tax=Roseiflexaceae TaxID=1508635 RepID=A7NNN3_ROSCS|nr:3-deoxy-7-phosphoheptulonate synthase [Roseiflexus castenholzii]ABU59174.1 phospho-2-dehydro-3-deoxyheptonate aldolase [Roseiflexus castenholzii DSM 13941]
MTALELAIAVRPRLHLALPQKNHRLSSIDQLLSLAKENVSMIVVMRSNATEEELNAVLTRIQEHGLKGRVTYGEERNIVGVIGAAIPPTLREELERFPGVQEAVRITRPYKLAAREFHPHDTIVQVGDLVIGGGSFIVIAGPCAVESEEQIMTTAFAVREAGAHMLRGGAFKPRSSPYTFRGLGEEGLRLLAQARAETGLPIVTEVMTPTDVELVARYADVLQIGARNMQNFQLLEEVGRSGKPALLKRGMSATIEEWLLSAEYIIAQGNPNVILCERGIRTFETATRNTMDLNAVALAKRRSHLPVIADPSHGTGKWYLAPPLALASLAAGADGVMLEVHPDPDRATSDGGQSLTCENFAALMPQMTALANVLGRRDARWRR